VQRRSGFTIVELLVALGIFAALGGLTIGAIQKARAAARKAECSDRLRQIGLALQHHAAVHGTLPPGLRTTGDPYPFLNWPARILPYVDQAAAWKDVDADYRKQWLFTKPVPHRNLARILPNFLCPLTNRFSAMVEEGDTAAFTDYLGVSGLRTRTRDGLLYHNSRVILNDVKDGASNTVMVGERPPSADNHFGWWYAGVGMSDGDGSADGTMAVLETNRTIRAPHCPLIGYKFSAGDEENMCDTFHFYSRHSGGAHFAFADGSVRFLSYSAADILPALATRAGGETATVP
jgi:prepilin-type processing-associated H-X9-DG protein/prepilin-type N-terminal cleavage/methylation domain-containing protein